MIASRAGRSSRHPARCDARRRDARLPSACRPLSARLRAHLARARDLGARGRMGSFPAPARRRAPSVRRLFLVSVPVIVAAGPPGASSSRSGRASCNRGPCRRPHRQGSSWGSCPAAGAVTVLVLRNRPPRTAAIYGSGRSPSAPRCRSSRSRSVPSRSTSSRSSSSGRASAAPSWHDRLSRPRGRGARAGRALRGDLPVSYLAFGIRAVVAGILVSVVGLDATVRGYGVLVTLAAATAFVLRLRERAVVPSRS